MKILKKILKMLSGKKSAIAAIIMTVVAYLGAKEILGELEVTTIGAIITILFGAGSYATGKLIYNKPKVETNEE